jgi:hypothetical protein
MFTVTSCGCRNEDPGHRLEWLHRFSAGKNVGGLFAPFENDCFATPAVLAGSVRQGDLSNTAAPNAIPRDLSAVIYLDLAPGIVGLSDTLKVARNIAAFAGAEAGLGKAGSQRCRRSA